MARNITLQFGLVTIPAKSDVAVEKKPDMANLCVGQPGHDSHPASPLKAPRTCTSCGEITDYDALLKGIKSGSTYTLVSQEDVAEAKESYSGQYKGILNLVPHPAAEFLAATAPGESLHYITPADAKGADHYRLLVKLIQSHPELVFVGLYTPVSATGLYMLSVREDVLVMEQRTRSQALKPAPSVGGEVNDALYAMLEGALAMFVTPYDATAYEDGYATALAKIAADGDTVTVGKEEKKVSNVVVSDDTLMEKLRALTAVA